MPGSTSTRSERVHDHRQVATRRSGHGYDVSRCRRQGSSSARVQEPPRFATFAWDVVGLLDLVRSCASVRRVGVAWHWTISPGRTTSGGATTTAARSVASRWCLGCVSPWGRSRRGESAFSPGVVGKVAGVVGRQGLAGTHGPPSNPRPAPNPTPSTPISS